MTNKIKKYRCKYSSNVYSARTLTGLKQCCTEIQCMTSAAMVALEKKRKALIKSESEKWKQKKSEYKFQTVRQSQEPLQKAINQIVRLIDEEEPCIARPFEYSAAFDAGHIFSVGAHPALRYHMWNIHKQSVKSNKHLGGEQLLMLEGIDIRYGNETRQYIESLPQLVGSLKPTIDEKMSWLKIANRLIKEIKSGKKYSRNEINQIMGIYKI